MDSERVKAGSNTSEDATVFAKAVETMFRKLVRFLVGRVSLSSLQEMLRHIYVEEADSQLQIGRPGRSVPLTKLAVITGLDTRTVAQIRKSIYENNVLFEQLPLKELTPESAVVEAWAQSVSEDNGESNPDLLSYDGPDSGFERLFRRVVKSRGVTAQSVIERLVATKSVDIDRSKKTIRLIVSRFSPYFADDEPNAIISALSALSNLASTVEHNVGMPKEERLFQRQAWTFRLNPSQKEEFRSSLNKLLTSMDIAAGQEIAKWEEKEYEEHFLTAGVGIYYFED